MTALPFPVITAPGRKTQASGGRLINCYIEQLAQTAGEKLVYWRVPGIKAFGTSSGANYRGGILVGNTAYVVWDTKAYSFTSAGGAGTQLTGTVPGTAQIIFARDNASTPNVVGVSPGDGAFIIASGAVSGYPDPDVGQPNGVAYLRGAFHFTYGDGKVRNSDTNSTNINTLSVATAESKPDTLYRPIPLGDGSLLLAGSDSTEVWGGQQVNDTGYLFNYIGTIPRGIVGSYAIAGHEDGWGKGIFLVGDDNRVSILNGYTPTPVSSPDLERLIEVEPDKSQIHVSVYIAQGVGYVVVQAPTWCWEYNTTLQEWHERQSYLVTYWRGMRPFKAFDKWLCGDRKSGNLRQIDGSVQDEMGDPLRMRIETGPIGAFPQTVRINALEMYLTKGVGIATGSDPVQTDPDVEVSISRDGGTTWSAGRNIKVGPQSLSAGRVRSSIWGHAEVQGVRFRFDESSNVAFGFMGADIQTDVLR